jgi:hypothetical protein
MRKKFIIIVLLFWVFYAHAQSGTWSGKIEVQGMDLAVVFHIDETSCTFDSPDQGVRGIPAELILSETDNLRIQITSIGATYEGKWNTEKIVGTFTQNGFAFPLTLTPGEPKLNRPQTPKEPFPYNTEEVSFNNGDAVLSGTLVLPKGYTRQTPVFIMVTGSGLQNRDEEFFEHKPFAVIADALAKAGIATLRYDDRGFGASTGDAVFCTTEDLKNDALAGIKLLRNRFDHVGVIGHSEGGTIGLMLAAEKEVDAVISLAGMVVSGKDLLLWQNHIILSDAGFSEKEVDSYCNLLEDAFNACVAGTLVPSSDSLNLPNILKQNYQGVIMQLQSPYMKYFLALDARNLLDHVTCPILALNGTKDTQVECDKNLDALRIGLPNNSANHIEVVEGLNHMFQHCRTGVSTEYRQIEETFDLEVIEKMIRWILDL